MLLIPYLDYIETQSVDNTVNGSAILPNVNRRESTSSNTNNSKILQQSYQRVPSRGNSSVRRVVPPSANSIANYVNDANQSKRTVSASFLNNELEQKNLDYSPPYLTKGVSETY